MRANNVLALIAVTLVILSSSCCKDPEECDEPWFVEIAEPLKEYLFIPGSQWVYLHENTGLSDTVTLESLTDTIWQKFPPYPGEQIYQFCYNRYRSSYRNINYKEIIYRRSIARVDTFHVNGGQGMFVHSSTPYAVYDSAFSYIELLPSYVVNGNSYSNVRHFKTRGRNYQSAFQYDTDTYYAQNIGLIKWIEHDPVNGDQTFNLQSSTITKYSLIKRCKSQ